MSTTSEILKSIENNVSNAYNSLENKRAVIPDNKNIQNLSSTIDSIKPKLEDIVINPSRSTQIFTPTGDNDGIRQVSVNPVTRDIDSNIISSNIRKGTTILGVTGNLDADKPNQTKVVDPKTYNQLVEADYGYELGSVTVNAVKSNIDSNIKAENIKKNVSILGVVGSYEPSGNVSVEKFICRAIDYDGTILKEEELAVGEKFTLPDFPEYERIIAQGWSSPVDIVNNQITVVDRDIVVGVMYETKSGLSEFDYIINENNNIATVNMVGTKDWGDGTINTDFYHVYTTYGRYIVTCDGTDVTPPKFDGSTLLSVIVDGSNYNCVNINLGSCATNIGSFAFAWAEGLETLTIPKSVTSIAPTSGGGVFNGTPSLKCLIVPNEITKCYANFGGDCFKRAVIPNANYSPDSLISFDSDVISLPNNPIAIGCDGMFDKITIPNNYTSVSVYSPALKELTIPNSVTKLNVGKCNCLRELTIPNSVIDLSVNNCVLLKELTIPDSITSIKKSCFSGCTSLKNVLMTDSVTSIGQSAFYECYSLENIQLSNNITTIDRSAFQYCYSLGNIKIPSSVTTIGNKVFSECYSLKVCDLSDHTSIPTLGSSAFSDANIELKIIVPDSLYDSWITATNWSEYADYIYKASEVEL